MALASSSSVKTSGINEDVLQLGEGLTPATTQLVREGEYLMDLTLIFGEDDSVTVKQYFGGQSGNLFLKTIAFADGTQWNFADVASLLEAAGIGSNDMLIGTAQDDVLDGGAGDDLLTGNGGNDILLGGSGNDTIFGGDQSDVLAGGKGTDMLSGADGDDHYLFNLGDGQDTIMDSSGNDRIVFGPGITAGQITASQISAPGMSLITLTVASGDTISFLAQAGVHDIELFEFADGSVLGADWITSLLNPAPVAPAGADAAVVLDEDGAYTLRTVDLGFAGALAGDSLSAVRIDSLPLAGNLQLNGTSVGVGQLISAADLAVGHLVFHPAPNTYGNSHASLTFSVADQHGVFDESPNALTFHVTPVNDVPVLAQHLPDQSVMQGAALTYTLATSAFTDADAGDVLTYTALLADGSTLPAWLSFDPATCTLQGTPPAGDAADLSIRITATDPAGASASSVFTLHIEPDYALPIESPTTHTLAEHYLNLTLTGTAAINGTGNAEANQLTGNSAANVLSGGSGDDTYVYHLGGGSDTIIELSGEGHDTLRLGEGITPTYPSSSTSIRTSREGSDLILSFGAAGTSDQVRVSGYFDVDGGTIETIAFANGKTRNFHDVVNGTVLADAPPTKVTYVLKRIGGDELYLEHPVAGLGQDAAQAVHVIYGTSWADTFHVGADQRVDARRMGLGADSIYLTGRFEDYLQGIDRDSGMYTFAHRTRAGEVIQITSAGEDDVIYFADGHIVFNALTDARLFDFSTETFLPILASYLLPGGTPVDAPDATLTIQGIDGTTLNATLSRPLATVLSDAQAQGSVATGSPMVVSIAGLNGQDFVPLQRSGQAMTVRGGMGADSVYVTPGTAIDARILSAGDDRIYFTGRLEDYTQTIDQNSAIYTFTHKTRPTEVVRLTSMGEDDELWFADGHIVFNALADARIYNQATEVSMAIEAEWLSPGGTPILTERLEYSTDGGTTWQDATASVNGTTVTINDPTLSEGSTIQLRVASQTAQGAVTATQVTSDGDDAVLIGTAELASLAHSRYDGGAGRDTLALKNDQSGVLLDFAAYGADTFTGIEQIDLTGGGNNTARLTIDQLLHMPDAGEDRLIVLGDAGDSVELVGGSGSWSSQGVQSWQGLDYDVYAHSGALERELFVQQGVGVLVV